MRARLAHNRYFLFGIANGVYSYETKKGFDGERKLSRINVSYSVGRLERAPLVRLLKRRRTFRNEINTNPSVNYYYYAVQERANLFM